MYAVWSRPLTDTQSYAHYWIRVYDQRFSLQSVPAHAFVGYAILSLSKHPLSHSLNSFVPQWTLLGFNTKISNGYVLLTSSSSSTVLQRKVPLKLSTALRSPPINAFSITERGLIKLESPSRVKVMILMVDLYSVSTPLPLLSSTRRI